MKKAYVFFVLLCFQMELLFVLCDGIEKVSLGSTQPTGGNYTIYKIEEYIYCLLTGFLMLLVMGIIISLNEQNALISDNTLSMASNDTISVANAQVDQKNEGKLVLMTEDIVVKWPIFEDELFFNLQTGYKFFRKVEMLQHSELKETSGSNVYYYYPLIWKAEEINSDKFNNQEYKNIKYEDWKMFDREFIARDASIGGFMVYGSTIANLENYKEYNLDDIKFDIGKISKKFDSRFTVTRKENFLYFSQNKEEETSGDFRITYFVSYNERVTIIGKQVGNTIEPFDYYFENAQVYYADNMNKKSYLQDLEGKTYTTDNKKYVLTPKTLKRMKRNSAYKELYSFIYGGSGITLTINPIQTIFKIILGKYNKDYILDEIKKENPSKVWKVRFWGFVVNFLSFCIIATPFREYFEYIPYYGDIKNFAYTIFAASFSLVLTILIVIFSWWKFKPYKAAVIASIIFILPAVGGGIYAFYYKNK